MVVPDCRDQFLAHAVGRTQPEFTLRFIEHVDGAGLGAGKLGRLGDNRGQHGLKVKRRGYRLSDFAERSQFTDRLRKFMRALLDLLFEADCRLFLFRHELIERDRIVAKYFDRSRHFADLIGATLRKRRLEVTFGQSQHTIAELSETGNEIAPDVEPDDQRRTDQAEDHRDHKDPSAEVHDGEGPGIRVRDVLGCSGRQACHFGRKTVRQRSVFAQQLRSLGYQGDFAQTQSRDAIVADREWPQLGDRLDQK